MHDHLRRSGPHRRDHRLAVQPVDDDGSAPAARNCATLPGVLVVAVTS
jgi:hypothetical protein